REDTDTAAEHRLDDSEGKTLPAGREDEAVIGSPHCLDTVYEATELHIIELIEIVEGAQYVAVGAVAEERDLERSRAPLGLTHYLEQDVLPLMRDVQAGHAGEAAYLLVGPGKRGVVRDQERVPYDPRFMQRRAELLTREIEVCIRDEIAGHRVFV